MHAAAPTLLALIVLLSMFTSVARGYTRVVVWLDSPDPLLIHAVHPRLVIVDPDYGPGGLPWEAWMTRMLRDAGAVVCAYINVGFAEEWRWYWPRLVEEEPQWLTGVENPGWPGEHLVAFWRRDALEGRGSWLSLLEEYVDMVRARGFNCIYLDNLDAYLYWLHPSDYGLPLEPVPNATLGMAHLVGNLSEYARRKGMRVYGNIGEGLDLPPLIHGSLDGILREDVFVCNGTPCEGNGAVIEALEEAARAGLEVFILDYVDDYGDVALLEELAREHNFTPIASWSLRLDTLPANVAAALGVYAGRDTVCGAYYNGTSHLLVTSRGVVRDESLGRIVAYSPVCNNGYLLVAYLGGGRYELPGEDSVIDGVVWLSVAGGAEARLYLNGTFVVGDIAVDAYPYGVVGLYECGGRVYAVYPEDNETLAVALYAGDRLTPVCRLPGWPAYHAALCKSDEFYILSSNASSATIAVVEGDECRVAARNLPPSTPLPLLYEARDTLAYTAPNHTIVLVKGGVAEPRESPLQVDAFNTIIAGRHAYILVLDEHGATLVDPPLPLEATRGEQPPLPPIHAVLVSAATLVLLGVRRRPPRASTSRGPGRFRRGEGSTSPLL